jgi:hypothetical protein
VPIDADIAKLEGMLKDEKREPVKTGVSSGDDPHLSTGELLAAGALTGAGALEAAGEPTAAGAPAAAESLPRLEAEIPLEWTAGRDLTVEVKTGAIDRFPEGLTLRHRRTNQLEGAFKSLVMKPIDEGYRGVIPGRYIRKDWDLLVYITGVLSPETVVMHPGLYNPIYPLPYFVVRT